MVQPANDRAGQPALLGFIAGGEHWMIDASSGVHVIDAPITPVPLAKAWYLGLVCHRQKLLGAVDLGGLRGADVATLRPTERLLVLPERWHTALRIDRVQGLMDASAVDSGNADGLHWQMLDIERLCTSTVFQNAGIRQSA